jgi:hypothetical protein
MDGPATVTPDSCPQLARGRITIRKTRAEIPLTVRTFLPRGTIESMATLPSHTRSPNEADDLQFREQCRRQLARTLETRMRYGFCRVPRPGFDACESRVFHTTRDYREWCAANLPPYFGYQPAPPE